MHVKKNIPNNENKKVLKCFCAVLLFFETTNDKAFSFSEKREIFRDRAFVRRVSRPMGLTKRKPLTTYANVSRLTEDEALSKASSYYAIRGRKNNQKT